MSPSAEGHVLVVRHPETVANAARRYVGASESPYTPLGAAQASTLALSIAAWGPDRVYSSPRERALAVARAVAEHRVPLIVLDAIGEIDFGGAEGMTAHEMGAAGLRLDYPGLPRLDGTRVCGESWDSFERRVAAAGKRFATHAGKTAVVAHGGVVRVLMMSWLGIDAQAAFKFALSNGAAALFAFNDGRARLTAFGPAELLCAM